MKEKKKTSNGGFKKSLKEGEKAVGLFVFHVSLWELFPWEKVSHQTPNRYFTTTKF